MKITFETSTLDVGLAFVARSIAVKYTVQLNTDALP